MIDKLILFDGLACVYRSYFAIRELNTSSGTAVNALYGFILQMESVIREMNPSHVGVVFDGGLSAERTQIHPEYKAQRPEMPDNLRSQLPLINEFLDALGVFWFLGEGIEADDAIASMARRFKPDCASVYIVTSDKDMFQLVDDKVRILLPGKDRKIMDSEAVKAKTGVGPNGIVDWLSMVGDPSDNIPGVPGVGAKTAAGLLSQFGSLEGILGNLNMITREKIRGSLDASREILTRNVDLVRLKEIECGVELDELLYKPHFGAGLESFLQRMEFGSMLERLRDGHFLC